MTNLEKLEKEIRLKLPRLMELSDGCIVKFKMMNGVMSKHFIIQCIDDKGDVYCNNGYTKPPQNNLIIIGHEIQLNDVLEWFRNKNVVNNRYVTISFTEREGFIRIGEHYLIGDWDLSKNLLKDQSQELIDSLSELIPQ